MLFTGCGEDHPGGSGFGQIRETSLVPDTSLLIPLLISFFFLFFFLFFFFFHVRKVMCQCRNKVWREAHITQQREHPIIMFMNYKRTFFFFFILFYFIFPSFNFFVSLGSLGCLFVEHRCEFQRPTHSWEVASQNRQDEVCQSPVCPALSPEAGSFANGLVVIEPRWGREK